MVQACSICLKDSEGHQLYKLSESASFSSISCATQHSSKLILQHWPPHQLIFHSFYFASYFLTYLTLLSFPPPSPHLSIYSTYHPLAQSPAHEVNMPSLHYAAGLAGIIFSLLQTTSALPTSDPTPVPSTLFPRALDKYVDCSDDQKKKLGQGFADAATLARWTFDHPISLGHTAYVLPCLLLQSGE